MRDKRCKCSMSISVLGDGCRYCQPQEYIDNLETWLSEERQQLVTIERETAETCESIAVGMKTGNSVQGYRHQPGNVVAVAIRNHFNLGG